MTSEEAGNATEVTFDLTQGDLARFRRYRSERRMPAMRWFAPILSIFVPLFILANLFTMTYLSPARRFPPKQRLQAYRLIAGPILLMLLIFPAEGLVIFGIMYLVGRSSKQVAQAHRKVEIAPDGVTYGSATGTIRLPWSYVKDVRQYRRDVFFECGQFGGMIVPGRVFADNKMAAAFASNANRLRGGRVGSMTAPSNTIAFFCDGFDITRARTERERLATNSPVVRPIVNACKVISAGTAIYGLSPIFGAPGSPGDIWHIISIASAITIASILQVFVVRKGPRVEAVSLLEPTELSLGSGGVSRIRQLSGYSSTVFEERHLRPYSIITLHI